MKVMNAIFNVSYLCALN